MAARAYVIVGPPGSGKSLLLRLARERRISGLNASILSKETTRRARTDEGTEIVPVTTTTSVRLTPTEALIEFINSHPHSYYWNEETSSLSLSGPLPFEELQELFELIEDSSEDKNSLQRLYDEANVISSRCDIVYEQYSSRYGFATRDLITVLNQGRSTIGVVNDLRAIRDLKALLGPLVVLIFLYRRAPDYADLQASRGAVGSDGLVDTREATKRKDKAKVILRRYIENIELFDHVILNTTDSPDDLLAQINGIVDRYLSVDEPDFAITEGLFA